MKNTIALILIGIVVLSFPVSKPIDQDEQHENWKLSVYSSYFGMGVSKPYLKPIDKETIKRDTICPACGDRDCIYLEIDNSTNQPGTDREVFKAILEVGKRRGLNDKQIDTLLNEYYL